MTEARSVLVKISHFTATTKLSYPITFKQTNMGKYHSFIIYFFFFEQLQNYLLIFLYSSYDHCTCRYSCFGFRSLTGSVYLSNRKFLSKVLSKKKISSNYSQKVQYIYYLYIYPERDISKTFLEINPLKAFSEKQNLHEYYQLQIPLLFLPKFMVIFILK